MRTRIETEKSFICLALQVARIGRRKFRLLIYKVWIPDKVGIAYPLSDLLPNQTGNQVGDTSFNYTCSHRYR
jgi:hypothetical protein